MTSEQDELSPMISLDKARTRLAVQWLGGGALIILILVTQSLTGHYGSFTQEAWGWVLPILMPTLGMVVTVLGYTALDPASVKGVVRLSYFRVSFWLSNFYLVLISMTILVQPLVDKSGENAVKLMQMSNLWLGPVQGLVAAALGVLFVSKKPVELVQTAPE